jgi:transcriptional regulator with XRE-family HTH domain
MFDIKALRLKKGISQTILAENIGVTLRTIQHWEKGSKNITVDKLERIINFFEIKSNLYYSDNNESDLRIVNESESEYNSKNEIKIKDLENKIKHQELELKFYKEQIDLYKNK